MSESRRGSADVSSGIDEKRRVEMAQAVNVDFCQSALRRWRQVRTALIHLEDKGEIKKEPSRKYTIFTITRYDFYVCGIVIIPKSEGQNNIFPIPDFGSQGDGIGGRGDTQNDTQIDINVININNNKRILMIDVSLMDYGCCRE